mgnify:CR=1 FL=1
MAFGAIEKTHAQVQDYFAEWFNDYPDERQRNMIQYQVLGLRHPVVLVEE